METNAQRSRQYADHTLNHLQHLSIEQKLILLDMRVKDLEGRFRLYLIINGVILVGYLLVVLF